MDRRLLWRCGRANRSSGNSRDRAEPDRAARATADRLRYLPARRQKPLPRLKRRRCGRAADRHRPVRDRDGGAERGNPAQRRRARWAICCFPSPASPVRASRPARRAGRSSAASTSTASASWRTASAPAASPISAKTISCRSIRWPPIRSRSSADRRRCATARRRSAASSRATNNRIPDAFLPCRVAPARRTAAPTPNFAARGTSVDNGLEGGAAARCRRRQLRAPCRRVRPQGGRLSRAELSVSFRPPGRCAARRSPAPSTAASRTRRCARTASSIGGSYIFNDGFVGLAVTQNNALYHIPGIDGEDHDTRIDAHQTKVLTKGEWRAPTARSTPSASGVAPPTTSTTSSGLPIQPIRRPTACARPSPTRSRKAASRFSSRRSTCASPR